MAIDHFKKHNRHEGQVDWNFNLTFDNQESVVALAEHYKQALAHPGLYDPIPPEWLHSTILALGDESDYAEEEMLAVADILQTKLVSFELPIFHFSSWWLWGGNIVFQLSPDDKFTKIYDAVIESLKEVVGEARTTKTPHGKFIAHTALAYTRDNDDEKSLYDRLMKVPNKPTSFKATNVSLLKQWPTKGHYEWEVIKRIPIGKG